MPDLSVQLAAAMPAIQSEYDRILRLIAENQVPTLELGGTFALPGSIGDNVAELTLPELPAGGAWTVAAVGDAQASLVTTGTALTTDIVLEGDDGTTLASIAVANTEADDTLVNAASVDSTALIPGGTRVQIDCDALGTGAVGPITVRLLLTYSKILADQITDLQ